MNEHKEWFEKKIKDKKNIYLVAKKNSKNIAIIRYDINKSIAETSIIIDTSCRGRGLGKKILKRSENFIKQKLILTARVNLANKPSFKIFRSNDYKILSLYKKIYTLYKIF